MPLPSFKISLLRGRPSADKVRKDVKENYAMSWHPEICFFGRDRAIRGMRRRRDWVAILALAIALLAIIEIRESWSQGIIASAALKVKLCIVATRNMICDAAAACLGILKCFLGQGR